MKHSVDLHGKLDVKLFHFFLRGAQSTEILVVTAAHLKAYIRMIRFRLRFLAICRSTNYDVICMIFVHDEGNFFDQIRIGIFPLGGIYSTTTP